MTRSIALSAIGIVLAWCAFVLSGGPLCAAEDASETEEAPTQPVGTPVSKPAPKTESATVKLTPAEALQVAAKLYASGRISRAWALYNRLAAGPTDAALRTEESLKIAQQATAAIEQIVAEGRQQVKEALALDDPTAALIKLGELSLAYDGTPVRPSIREAYRILNFRMARRKLDEGGEEGEPSEADMQAKALLIIGDIHNRNGRPEKAREAYEAVVYEYPDSPYTPQARAKLAVIEELQQQTRAAETTDGKDTGDEE